MRGRLLIPLRPFSRRPRSDRLVIESQPNECCRYQQAGKNGNDGRYGMCRLPISSPSARSRPGGGSLPKYSEGQADAAANRRSCGLMMPTRLSSGAVSRCRGRVSGASNRGGNDSPSASSLASSCVCVILVISEPAGESSMALKPDLLRNALISPGLISALQWLCQARIPNDRSADPQWPRRRSYRARRVSSLRPIGISFPGPSVSVSR
jgi:hypothetical protein